MRSVAVQILLVFIVQTRAANALGNAQEDRWVHSLFDRALPLHSSNLGSTTLGKPGHLVTSDGINLRANSHPSPWAGHRLQFRTRANPPEVTNHFTFTSFINSENNGKTWNPIGGKKAGSSASGEVRSASSAAGLWSITDQPLSSIKSQFAKYEQNLDDLYEKSFTIKCPFFRRRAFDTIEAMKRILVFVVARHKSTPLFPNPRAKLPVTKTSFLPLNEIAAVIHRDWVGRGKGKGYYITGALTEEIYDEDCIFDGPDPDMPVRGLRKYLLSASQLFDSRKSRADLTRPIEYDNEKGTITAYWRLEGILNLPWHPHVKPWTGSTTYHIDAQSGLVSSHTEVWDISVPDAFISTLFPGQNFGASAANPVNDLMIGSPRPVKPFRPFP